MLGTFQSFELDLFSAGLISFIFVSIVLLGLLSVERSSDKNANKWSTLLGSAWQINRLH
jgi:hypothetical protein